MNKRLISIYMFLTLLLVPFPEAFAVNRTILPNGITILTKPVTTNRIVSFVVTLRMGSLYETDEEAGLCTLMQETLRKGTENRTSEQIALELESMGTRLSTSSNREYGSVEMQSTSESLYKSLEILYDILTVPTFPKEFVELQKNLQIQAIHTRYDQPIYRAIDLMVDAHYIDHPFHKPLMGYPETIETFTRDDVVAMYKRLYVPENMVISVVGNFNEKQLIGHISKYLCTLPEKDIPLPVETDNKYLLRKEPVEKVETRETAANWFTVGWTAPPLNDDEYPSMEVLDAITGGSMNSRLFIAIREKRGLAYQVSSFYNARKESGLYVAYIGTKPETYIEAKNVLLDEVFSMGKETATEEEIRLAKNFLKGMYIMSQESNSGQASHYGHYEILGIGYEFLDAYAGKIENVTAENVLETGKRYLRGNYSFGAVISE